MNPANFNRRRFRFGLRALLIAVVVIAGMCGWLVTQGRTQRLAVRAIRGAGAEVGYDYGTTWAPQWLLDLLGVDFFCNVTMVHVYKNTNLADDDLKQLQAFPDLQCLYIDRTTIGDAGLLHLTALSRLQFLYLDRTCVTDAGLASLTKLPKLHELSLGKTQITDAGLRELANMKQLQFLNVRDTNVSRHGVEEFKNAMPTVNVTQ